MKTKMIVAQVCAVPCLIAFAHGCYGNVMLVTGAADAIETPA